MERRRIAAVVLAPWLVGAGAPATAGPSDATDDRRNGEKGPADAGPPGFVSGPVGGVAGVLGDPFATPRAELRRRTLRSADLPVTVPCRAPGR